MLDALTWFPDLPARPGRLAADLRVRPQPPLREPLIRKVGAPPWARGTLRFARLMRPSREVMLVPLVNFAGSTSSRDTRRGRCSQIVRAVRRVIWIPADPANVARHIPPWGEWSDAR